MSMTLEEAIKNREECLRYLEDIGAKATPSCVEAVRWSVKALQAFRPVSREQVEKMWPGCDFCNTADFGEFGFEITKHYAKICCALGSWRFPEKEQFLFCPKCGKPLTDEAVDMVMERLEALRGETETD